jgi:hypothetical protein
MDFALARLREATNALERGPVVLLFPHCRHLARLRQQHAMDRLTADYEPTTPCRKRYRAVQHLLVLYVDMLGDFADGHPLRVFAGQQVIHALAQTASEGLVRTRRCLGKPCGHG